MSSRRVLVTGASTGIGAETARLLVERGYQVIMAARRVDRMEDLAQSFDGPPDRVAIHSLDLQSDESIAELVRQCREDSHPPDVLINNAGYGVYGRVDQVPMDEVRELFETNLLGMMELTTSAIQWMKERGEGRIINVASGVAKRGFPGMGAYSASKAAMESISESMKLELEPFDISVQVVYPIQTETSFSDAARRFVPGGFSFPSHGPVQSAEEVAETIVDGMNSSRFRLHPHPSSKILGLLNEVAPWFVESVTGLRTIVRRTFEDSTLPD